MLVVPSLTLTAQLLFASLLGLQCLPDSHQSKQMFMKTEASLTIRPTSCCHSILPGMDTKPMAQERFIIKNMLLRQFSKRVTSPNNGGVHSKVKMLTTQKKNFQVKDLKTQNTSYQVVLLEDVTSCHSIACLASEAQMTKRGSHLIGLLLTCLTILLGTAK